jgi:hypothetical protein
MKTHAVNKSVPENVILRRPAEGEEKVSQTPKVKGDQSLMVMDVVQKAPVEVFLLQSETLDPDGDGRVIFVQGAVSNGIMPAAAAIGKFAVMNDGTLAYNARGFDDLPGAEFDLIDVAKLIEHNN